MLALLAASVHAEDAPPDMTGIARPSVEELWISQARPADSGRESDTREAMCLMIESAARANDLPLEFFARVIWQESRFRPDATGPVTRRGQRAQGIAQFMPPTWDDVRAALAFPAHATPFDPAYAIKGAAWYLGLLRRQWRSPRAEDDRRRLVQASYNAGLGNVVKAQKRAGGATAYESIAARLHDVTGADHARETRAYVDRIERIHRELVGV